MADLGQLKKDFSQLVLKVPQWTLTQFVLWLDLKVAEFKVNGYMVLGVYNNVSFNQIRILNKYMFKYFTSLSFTVF